MRPSYEKKEIARVQRSAPPHDFQFLSAFIVGQLFASTTAHLFVSSSTLTYVFDQRVIERNRTAADVTEAPGQPGSFRMLSSIDPDSHPVTERTPLTPTTAAADSPNLDSS